MKSEYKLDLHTHSERSPDGGLRLQDYQAMLEHGSLDYIAITDHNTISFAVEAQARLGSAIIIGEEIASLDGEIIGLFLQTEVPSGLSAQETVRLIHHQEGLVYMPHPFETLRRGLSHAVLDSLADQTDIIEVFNGRALVQNKSTTARAWAKRHHVAMAASSDAHGWRGWGRTYSLVSTSPSSQNLSANLHGSTLVCRTVGLGVLYPKLNRLRKRGHRD